MTNAQTWTLLGTVGTLCTGILALVALSFPSMRAFIGAKFDTVDARFDAADLRFNSMDRRLEGLDRDVQTLSRERP